MKDFSSQLLPDIVAYRQKTEGSIAKGNESVLKTSSVVKEGSFSFSESMTLSKNR